MVKPMVRQRILLLLLAVICFSGCNGPEKPPVAAPANEPKAGVAPPVGKSQASATGQSNNTPPVITALLLENPSIHRGVDIKVNPEAIDPDGDLVQFRYRWFINDSEIPHDFATLAGDQFHKADRISVRVQPFDAESDGPFFYSEVFVIPNAPPRFTTTPPTRFKASFYSYQAKAEDPDNEPLIYRLIQGPAGMEIDSMTGQVSWNISKENAGMHTVSIEVQDQEGMKSRQEWQLDISIE